LILNIKPIPTIPFFVHYWMKKTPEERLDTVEFLREQFYAIQGYRQIPRIKKVVHKVEMDE